MATEHKTSVRPKDDGLGQAIERFEQCLSAAVPGREKSWAEEAQGALRGLEAILARHTEATEAADGMFTEVDLTRPTLSRQVGKLRQEHRTLAESVVGLRQELEQAAKGFQPPAAAPVTNSLPEPAGVEPAADFAAIRGKGEQLLSALKEHKSEEVDLLLESVDTDIGVGD
jgi:hypothetical protein